MLKIVLVALVLAWFGGAVISALFLRDRRHYSHPSQNNARDRFWRLKLAVIWPFWFFGILAFEIRNRAARRKRADLMRSWHGKAGR